ncbi:P-loop containing nucleoside triphosphate hydrolase protein [Jimgerdemannia flammicorona]|uniref:P-loop containing nucleoside triphosphate hydrolase protein n=1 Tax=Jimgerdemannia flammicorona TaxID=994334 RepID=A0A433Q3X5_9FUNG|nr:P-loop containing nucleoside triphosphate hydrolase protein [Jimgerdemannia flammicorona]
MATPNYKVKVVCRVRPFLKHESPDTSVQRYSNTGAVVLIVEGLGGSREMQLEIFQNDVRPLVEHVFGGLDATIFAYGVTGSGKTHTMQGADIDPGIIPRTVRLLFEKRRRSKKSVEFKVSYMEIYKESVFDLFIPRDLVGFSVQSPAGLPIREDGSRNIFVANLSEVCIAFH